MYTSSKLMALWYPLLLGKMQRLFYLRLFSSQSLYAVSFLFMHSGIPRYRHIAEIRVLKNRGISSWASLNLLRFEISLLQMG